MATRALKKPTIEKPRRLTEIVLRELLLPVRTFFATLALALHPEGADVGPVAFVERRLAGQFIKHLVLGGHFAELSIRHRVVSVR